MNLVGAGQEGDPAMSQLGEMTYRRTNPGFVIEKDGAGFGIAQVKLCEDNGDIVECKLVENRLFLAEGEHGHAFDLALNHAAHAGGQHRGIAVRGTDENLVAMRHRDLFKALDQFGKERVGDVFDNNPQDSAAAGDQASRVSVGEVVQLLDG